jgi:hypothetical protein
VPFAALRCPWLAGGSASVVMLRSGGAAGTYRAARHLPSAVCRLLSAVCCCVLSDETRTRPTAPTANGEAWLAITSPLHVYVVVSHATRPARFGCWPTPSTQAGSPHRQATRTIHPIHPVRPVRPVHGYLGTVEVPRECSVQPDRGIPMRPSAPQIRERQIGLAPISCELRVYRFPSERYHLFSFPCTRPCAVASCLLAAVHHPSGPSTWPPDAPATAACSLLTNGNQASTHTPAYVTPDTLHLSHLPLPSPGPRQSPGTMAVGPSI